MTHDNVTDIERRLQDVYGKLTPGAIETADLDGMAFTVADAITDLATIRKQLENAREALRVIAEGDEPRPIGIPWRNDGKPSKHDRCEHGRWMYDGCEECTSIFAREALKGQPC